MVALPTPASSATASMVSPPYPTSPSSRRSAARMASSRLGSRGRPPRRGDGSSVPGTTAMVSTSASPRPTALLQLAPLSVAQRTSTPVAELGHLAVITPDDGGQVSAAWTGGPHHPLRHGPPPTADRPGPPCPAAAMNPSHARGLKHPQRIRTPTPPSVWSEGAPSGRRRARRLSAAEGIACLLPLVADGRGGGRGLLLNLLGERRRGSISLAGGIGSRFGRHRPVLGARL